MTDDINFTKAELLDRIDTFWSELQTLVEGLDETTLTHAQGESGWSIADHLAHLAAWERGVAFLMSHRSRAEGMGISDSQWRELTMDEINDVVHQAWREKSGAEVMALSHSAHAVMLAALAELTVADLLRDYSDFDPSGSISGRPIIGWVVGNTFEHYREHLGYIRKSLGQ